MLPVYRGTRTGSAPARPPAISLGGAGGGGYTTGFPDLSGANVGALAGGGPPAMSPAMPPAMPGMPGVPRPGVPRPPGGMGAARGGMRGGVNLRDQARRRGQERMFNQPQQPQGPFSPRLY